VADRLRRGQCQVIAGLGKIKTNVDSGLFEAIQIAGIEALEGDQGRRRRCGECTAGAGMSWWGVSGRRFRRRLPRGQLLPVDPVPKPHTSAAFAKLLLERAAIVATPGNGFGDAGEGYFRMTLCLPEERLREAVERIKAAKLV